MLKPKSDAGSYHTHVDFVGDLSLFGDHQGHSGATFAAIRSNMEGRKTMQLHKPTFVLVLGGTNDFYQNHTVAQALSDAKGLLDSITANAQPDTYVLWSTTPLVVPSRCTRSSNPVRVFQCPPNMNANIRALNSKLPALLAGYNRTVLVNMSTAGFVEEDYWIGGVHFNTSGWNKMANVWYNALQPLLPRETHGHSLHAGTSVVNPQRDAATPLLLRQEEGQCTSVSDCFGLGDCVDGMCACDPYAAGAPDCSVFATLPLPWSNDGAQGYYNTSQPSWGGEYIGRVHGLCFHSRRPLQKHTCYGVA